ncbi:MAG: hypothetical protein Kow00107_06930 [Planctomycetota bacterium]
MTAQFNIAEVFELAMQMERNGARFYREAAQQVSGPQARGLLERLAEMEVEHENIFRRLATLVSATPEAYSYDPENEGLKYLQALVSRAVFDDASDSFRLLASRPSAHDVLTTAVRMENESIAYYTGIREFIRAEEKGKVDEIIREEMSHVVMLTNLLTSL